MVTQLQQHPANNVEVHQKHNLVHKTASALASIGFILHQLLNAYANLASYQQTIQIRIPIVWLIVKRRFILDAQTVNSKINLETVKIWHHAASNVTVAMEQFRVVSEYVNVKIHRILTMYVMTYVELTLKRRVSPWTVKLKFTIQSWTQLN